MIRFLIIIVLILLIVFLVRALTPRSEYTLCERCDGRGYWLATRGERDKCDACGGSGKVLR